MIKLTRITNSNDYLPYIDGFRFYALSIVLGHFVDFYEAHTFPIKETPAYKNLNFDFFLGLSSDNGILMFFAISGFILAMPFAKSIRNGEVSPSLKSFYKRRLTRLEPPYLIILIGLFVLNVFVIHRDTLTNTFPHFVASFFYLHNLVYQAHPTLNFVFWTLEIEVQFYLLAPLVVNVFRLPKHYRRLLMALTIMAFSIGNELYQLPFRSLLNYFQYFMAGMLALDFYLDKDWKKSYWYDVVCITAIFLMFTGVFKYGIVLPFIICLLLWMSPLSYWWIRVLSWKGITVIGGMCYSIYMLHHPLMALFLNRVMGNEMILSSVWMDFLLKMIAVLTVVLFCSAVYFVLVERPCMKRDWYKRFLPAKFH